MRPRYKPQAHAAGHNATRAPSGTGARVVVKGILPGTGLSRTRCRQRRPLQGHYRLSRGNMERRRSRAPPARLHSRSHDHRHGPVPAAPADAAADAPDLQRHPAVGDRPPRQRPRRDPQLRRAPGPVRGDLLHRRLPRPDEPPRPRRAPPPDARDGRVAPGARPRPGEVHAVRPEPPPRAHRARLAARDRHAGELGRADADLQGEAGAAAGRRQPRPAHVPDPAGRRHRDLPRRPRAGRQGPGRPPRAQPRDRPGLQPPLRRRRSPSRRRSSPRRRRSSAPTASGR